ncbi:MAG: hypothetical protein JWQ69_1643 [Pseudomonas sp.]|nr:hypothetical protein [Pseudomonas sp.]
MKLLLDSHLPTGASYTVKRASEPARCREVYLVGRCHDTQRQATQAWNHD